MAKPPYETPALLTPQERSSFRDRLRGKSFAELEIIFNQLTAVTQTAESARERRIAVEKLVIVNAARRNTYFPG